MKAIRAWLALFIEYALLGVALGCFGMYAFESVEARRFQAEQTAEFEEAAKARVAPVAARTAAPRTARRGSAVRESKFDPVMPVSS